VDFAAQTAETNELEAENTRLKALLTAARELAQVGQMGYPVAQESGEFLCKLEKALK
jgi:hypothetical protein